jgi:hypothetical protein
MVVKYNHNYSFLVLATVITIVNYDRKTFIVQATAYSCIFVGDERKKVFQLRRQVLGLRRKSRKASSSKTRESPANGSSSSTIHELEMVPSALPSLEHNGSVQPTSVPLAVTAKYDVGSVIGDGNLSPVCTGDTTARNVAAPADQIVCDMI